MWLYNCTVTTGHIQGGRGIYDIGRHTLSSTWICEKEVCKYSKNIIGDIVLVDLILSNWIVKVLKVHQILFLFWNRTFYSI